MNCEKKSRREFLESVALGVAGAGAGAIPSLAKSEARAASGEMTYRTLKMGFRVVEVPIVFVDRRVGQSKMSRKIFLEALTLVWKLRMSHLPTAQVA